MSDTIPLKLELRSLHERHVGLTESLGAIFCEAASVCLNRHHESPVEMAISSISGSNTRLLEFPKPDPLTLRAWANTTDTTEMGAYGVSLAAVEAEENLVAISRAETLSGADWYVAPVGAPPDDLESCFRLEISGVDAGGRAIFESRLRQKIEQARRGASNLPAIASVVGFKEKTVAIRKVD